MTEGKHLAEDEILQAVEEAEDVPENIRGHLAICPSCCREVELLRDDLKRLSQLSRDLAPVPSRPIRLPMREEKHSSGWSWQSAFAASLVTALVFLLFFWITPLPISFQNEKPSFSSKAWEDDRLMREIRILEENLLSPFHQFLVGGTPPGLSDEFMDFVSPILSGNST